MGCCPCNSCADKNRDIWMKEGELLSSRPPVVCHWHWEQKRWAGKGADWAERCFAATGGGTEAHGARGGGSCSAPIQATANSRISECLQRKIREEPSTNAIHSFALSKMIEILYHKASSYLLDSEAAPLCFGHESVLRDALRRLNNWTFQDKKTNFSLAYMDKIMPNKNLPSLCHASVHEYV